MTDFFDEKKEEAEAPEEGEVEMIKIGDDEYKPDELKELVGLGKLGKEAQEKWNTPIDKVYPEFTKKSQLLKEMEEKESQRVKAEESKEIAEKVDGGEELTPEQALAQAGKAGVVTKENFGNFYHQLREGERLVDDCKGLEKDIDGKDGRPKFVTSEILEHMKISGVRNPQDAYDLKFKPELTTWREKELDKAKTGGMVTEGSSTAGQKEPPKVDINRGNLDKMIKESLYGNK